jgi:S1-C subfamily serine protease
LGRTLPGDVSSAIPIEIAREVEDQLIRHGRVKRGVAMRFVLLKAD